MIIKLINILIYILIYIYISYKFKLVWYFDSFPNLLDAEDAPRIGLMSLLFLCQPRNSSVDSWRWTKCWESLRRMHFGMNGNCASVTKGAKQNVGTSSQISLLTCALPVPGLQETAPRRRTLRMVCVPSLRRTLPRPNGGYEFILALSERFWWCHSQVSSKRKGRETGWSCAPVIKAGSAKKAPVILLIIDNDDCA